jgi:hypothetical protein
VVQLRRVADAVEKHPVGFVWSECKDRALQPRSHRMLGAFHTTRKLHFSDHSAAHALEDGTPNGAHFMAHSVGVVIDGLSAIAHHHDAAAGEASSANDDATSTASAEESNLITAPVASYMTDRVLGSRHASDSKTEKAVLKKAWHNIYKNCEELLARALIQCNVPSCPAPLSTAALMEKVNPSLGTSGDVVEGDQSPAVTMPISRKQALPRATVEEALPLLEEASKLPPYINAPGESVGETIRTMLGELLKVGKSFSMRDYYF